MEILSTGEKIKRIRVYKGMTLKDICEDKISVSKMSCIENNKVVAEEWILELVAKKLDLDIEYLKYGVKEQIESNISDFSQGKNINIEDILYNIDYADKYKYYNLSCKLFQILFKLYLSKGNKEKLSNIIPRYYNSCQKSKDELLYIEYYMDIARYLCINKEYLQACSYFATVRRKLEEIDKKQSDEYIKAIYDQCASYFMGKEISKACNMIPDLIEVLEFEQSDSTKAEICKIIALVSIYLDKERFYEYKDKALSLYGENTHEKSKAYYNFGASMLENGMIEDGLKYINIAIEEYPKDDNDKLCKFYINIIKTLIEYDQLTQAESLSEITIDLAIEIDKVSYIDKAYYYKALLLEKQNKFILAETYINLSLDALVKYGSRDEIIKRYLRIGNMYYKLGELKDSIRYFDLAIKEEKEFYM